LKDILFFFLTTVARTVLAGQNPNGVVSGLELWFKANAGTFGIPTVSAWSDQSINGNNVAGFGNPQLISVGLNYNPTIAFDGTGDYFKASAYIQSNLNAFFIVVKAGFSGVAAEGIFTIADNDPSVSYDGFNPKSGALLLMQGTTNNLRARIDNTNIVTKIGALDGKFSYSDVVAVNIETTNFMLAYSYTKQNEIVIPGNKIKFRSLLFNNKKYFQ